MQILGKVLITQHNMSTSFQKAAKKVGLHIDNARLTQIQLRPQSRCHDFLLIISVVKIIGEEV